MMNDIKIDINDKNTITKQIKKNNVRFYEYDIEVFNEIMNTNIFPKVLVRIIYEYCTNEYLLSYDICHADCQSLLNHLHVTDINIMMNNKKYTFDITNDYNALKERYYIIWLNNDLEDILVNIKKSRYGMFRCFTNLFNFYIEQMFGIHEYIRGDKYDYEEKHVLKDNTIISFCTESDEILEVLILNHKELVKIIQMLKIMIDVIDDII